MQWFNQTFEHFLIWIYDAMLWSMIQYWPTLMMMVQNVQYAQLKSEKSRGHDAWLELAWWMLSIAKDGMRGIILFWNKCCQLKNCSNEKIH